MADRRVATDAFGQLYPLGDCLALEQFLDTLVHVPEARLDFEDGLADHREPEVAGFDEPCVHRPDGDLVYAIAFYGDEGEGLGRRKGRACPGIVAHGMPARRPMWVVDQGSEHGVFAGFDPEEV